MDLFVGLKKLDANGDEVFFYGFGGTNPNDIVARGFLRASHRELDAKRSTAWQPVHSHRRRLPLSAGEIVPLEIEIFPSATLFRRGERLRLVIQTEPIQPDAVLLKFVPVNAGRQIIHFGGQNNSSLLLPFLDL
jgi:predicted acyl esterase